MNTRPKQLATDQRDRWQSFYDNRARPCPFFLHVPDENLGEWMRQGLIPRGRALDVGCGNARNSIFLARNGFTVDAVDYSASAIAWARDEVAKSGAPVTLRCASIFEADIAPGSYDLVYDGGCFHHMPPHQRDEYVALVARALKPGGALALVSFKPEGGSGYTDEEVYERGSLGGGLGYDEQRMREMWETRFRIEVLRPMREQPAGADAFGKDFLWTMLARKK